MIIISLAFFLGDLLLQSLQNLPSQIWLLSLFIIVPLIYLYRIDLYQIYFYRNYTTTTTTTITITIALTAFIIGFSWSLILAHHYTKQRLPSELEGKTLSVIGTIVTLPVQNEHGISFILKTKSAMLHLENKKIPIHNLHNLHGLIKLSWHTKQPLHVGDVWQLNLKLKRIHSLSNPGGFDYEAYALEEHIIAQGYVLQKTNNYFIKNTWYWHPINTLREKIHEKLAMLLPKSNTSSWIEALIIGERHGIDDDKWEVLRKTGTNHLMAIAGLHIGFVSAMVALITLKIYRRSKRLPLYFPTPLASAIAALVSAVIYSVLAGFSLPTQRACIMLSVFLLTFLLRRNLPAWHAWGLALLIIIFHNPFCILSESFWLSFGSVALIIYGMSGRLQSNGLWWKWGRVQYVIAIGLIPLSIGLFHQFSVVGFVANSIAIPWVTFLIIPFCLMGCFAMLFSNEVSKFLLIIADHLLQYLWIILDYLSHLSFSSYYFTISNSFMIFVACVSIIILLAPKGFPGRILGVMGLLPFIFFQQKIPSFGAFWLTQLDVGQGLSSVIQTQHHLLIFDAGARLSSSYDMGASVVVPFLRSLQTNKIDTVVISHGDNDHIGGLNTIKKYFPIDAYKTSVPELIPSSQYCLRGEKWQWDGINFEFLYPTKDHLGLDNDSSCVLRISNQFKSILLTGDIEKFAEKDLVNFYKNNLHADILSAPHHGSKTSGQDSFIDAVHPSYVLYSTGYRNRFHFPNLSVMEKYALRHIKQINSVENGAIQIKISDKGMMQLNSYRLDHHHYWQ